MFLFCKNQVYVSSFDPPFILSIKFQAGERRRNNDIKALKEKQKDQKINCESIWQEHYTDKKDLKRH